MGILRANLYDHTHHRSIYLHCIQVCGSVFVFAASHLVLNESHMDRGADLLTHWIESNADDDDGCSQHPHASGPHLEHGYVYAVVSKAY